MLRNRHIARTAVKSAIIAHTARRLANRRLALRGEHNRPRL
jgi:hypothetical protein